MFGIWLVVFFLMAGPLLLALLAKATTAGNWTAVGVGVLAVTAAAGTARLQSKT